MAAADKGPQRDGPNPPNIILNALKRAVKAGVDRTQLGFALDMAIAATIAPGDGTARKQSDAFKQVAATLDMWTEEVKDAEASSAS